MDDIRIAEIQRADEIANFGKGDNVGVGPLEPDWNPPIELLDKRPPEFELICSGKFNGTNLPEGSIIITEYKNTLNMTPYLVWQQMPNREYDCEVIFQ